MLNSTHKFAPIRIIPENISGCFTNLRSVKTLQYNSGRDRFQNQPLAADCTHDHLYVSWKIVAEREVV